MAEKTKDTLFIDMKYIILYRKLGYDEIAPDVFRYQYDDTDITIYSEEQRFEFKGESYPLLQYKDFVLLEAIDRLLKKGYPSGAVSLNYFPYDVAILQPNGILYCGVYVAAWGKDYTALVSGFVKKTKKIECLYTSQLSGGLVDYQSKIFANGQEFSLGIFEKSITQYNLVFCTICDDRKYPDEFSVKNGELLKYLGKDSVVNIPEGITRIGTGAFWNNLFIEKVVLPESVKCICGDAFVYCENLKEVNIPQSVSEMGDDPFAGCLAIKIDNHSPYFICEDGVLFDDKKKFLIHYTASKQDTEYVIPETVTWIGKHSFYKCVNLRLVTITRNVKFMGNNAFSDCRNIKLRNESDYFHYIDGVLYDKNMTTCMHYSMGSGVKTVKLVDSVRTIGRNCFWNCDMIEKIIIPASVRQIGYNPFANCKNVVLENHSPYYAVVDGILYDATVREMVYCPPTAARRDKVIVPETVVNIGRSAFTGCDTLKAVELPKGLKFISRSSFSGCTALKEIHIPQSVEEIADWCFNGCTLLERAYIPEHIKLLPNTFNGCKAEIIRI